MDVVILAGGYGTRLARDISADTTGKWNHLAGLSKPLLPVGRLPLLSHWVKILQDSCSRICVVTNEMHYNQFLQWRLVALQLHDHLEIDVINDGSTSNETRLGAVADIELAVQHIKSQKDVLVVAGDTLFYEDFDIGKFHKAFEKFKALDPESCLIIRTDCAEENVSRHGIIEIDENYRVTKFLEKPQPQDTPSRLQCPCFYLLSNKSLSQLGKFLSLLKDEPLRKKDATGNFIRYLIDEVPVYTYYVKGRFDVGNLESYVQCHQHFSAATK